MEAKNIYIPIILVTVVTLFGIGGYVYIEQWSIADAFYMTVITLTTTGFQEVHTLSGQGRLFTAFLLIIGMGVVAYSATIIMSSIFSISFQSRRRKKMDKKIENLVGHTIVCGFGRMGKVICQELACGKTSFLVIEQNKELISDLQKTDFLWIEGNAANDETLLRAGVQKAKVLVSMIDNDADGLYLCLAARSYNPNIYTIIRANHESARERILKTGANKVVLPYVMSGKKVAQIVLNPAIEDFLDITGVNPNSEKRLQIVDIKISNNPQLVSKSLRSCGFKRNGLIIVGIKKNNGNFEFAPHADYAFEQTDCLIGLGTRESYEEVMKTHNLSL